MKSIVITGVSSGIGYGIAKEFVRGGYRVFGSVRKPQDAARLKSELGDSFVPLVFDVTNREAVLRGAEEVGEALGGSALDGLVNNAGTAIGGPLRHQPLEDVRAHFEINVIGLVSVTQAFLPQLEAKPGRIVNISSVGGKIAAPFIGAYAATKHAVEGISDSLRRELLPYGVDVIVVRPGAVRTEIWNKGEAGAGSYAETDYADALQSFGRYTQGLVKDGYSPEEFGVRVRKAFEARRPRTRYAIVPGRFANWTVPTLLPDRLLDSLIARNAGLVPGAFRERVPRAGDGAAAAR